jgi:hypothetical protein
MHTSKHLGGQGCDAPTSHTTAFGDSLDATALPRPPHRVVLALARHALVGVASAQVVRNEELADNVRFIDRVARALAVLPTAMKKYSVGPRLDRLLDREMEMV